MKLIPCFALVVLSVLPSCEKIRNLSSRLNKPTPAVTPPTYDLSNLVVEITNETYETFPQKTGKLVIIDFYADWCPPCVKLSPILEKIAAEHGGNVIIGKVNVDKCSEIATKEKISSIPEVRIFRDGKMVDKFVGLPDEKEIRQKIQTAAKGLSTPVPATEKASGKKEDTIQPMSKDWMPEGIQRR